jgi:hypothetical protein
MGNKKGEKIIIKTGPKDTVKVADKPQAGAHVTTVKSKGKP